MHEKTKNTIINKKITLTIATSKGNKSLTRSAQI